MPLLADWSWLLTSWKRSGARCAQFWTQLLPVLHQDRWRCFGRGDHSIGRIRICAMSETAVAAQGVRAPQHAPTVGRAGL